MPVRTPARSTADPAAARPRARLADRLFVGGCTAVYVALLVTVLAALELYRS